MVVDKRRLQSDRLKEDKETFYSYFAHDLTAVSLTESDIKLRICGSLDKKVARFLFLVDTRTIRRQFG